MEATATGHMEPVSASSPTCNRPGLANTHQPPATKEWSSTRPNPHLSCCHVVHACACGSGHRQKGTCATSSDRCNPWNQTTFQVLSVAVRPVFDMCTVQCLSVWDVSIRQLVHVAKKVQSYDHVLTKVIMLSSGCTFSIVQ
jgi:hypothetical protein